MSLYSHQTANCSHASFQKRPEVIIEHSCSSGRWLLNEDGVYQNASLLYHQWALCTTFGCCSGFDSFGAKRNYWG